MSEEKSINERAGKANKAQYVSHCLSLIAKNKTKNETVKSLMSTYNITQVQAYKWYLLAAEELEENNSEKIKTIRNKRIAALQADIDEAYANYLAESDGNLRAKWFEIYQKTKTQLDVYYPNALKPEAEKEELKIEISYNKINRLPSKDE
jgi:hypothetical protein